MKTRDPYVFEDVYSILVREAQANPDDRRDFVSYHVNRMNDSSEWRFGGDIGSGAKFYVEAQGFRVGYYPEEESEKVDAQVRRINLLLRQLVEKRLTP